jgi:ribonucleoside-diphosphate reductase alpha chain
MDAVTFGAILSKLYEIHPKITVRVANEERLLADTKHLTNAKQRLDSIANIIEGSSVKHPGYGSLAGRLLAYSLDNHSKISSLTFSERMERIDRIPELSDNSSRRLSPEFLSFVREHRQYLDSYIDYNKNYDYDFFGLNTMFQVYLADYEGECCETAQDFHMRVAVQIAINATGRRSKNKLEVCRLEYDDLSQHKKIYATPINRNSGYLNPQLSSCFLVDMDDSIKGIYGALRDCALMHAGMGGCAIAVHDMRASGSIVKSTGGDAAGMLAFCKNFDHTSSIVKAGGRRSGSNAAWYCPDHLDTLDMLTAKTLRGQNKMRHLFQGLMMPDLFFERVLEDGDWYLFDPSSFPNLARVSNGKYRELYADYEDKAKKELAKKGVEFLHQSSGITMLMSMGRCARVRALEVWNCIKIAISEGSIPYLMGKDAINRRNQQDNLGPIVMSNLCTEILQFTDPNHTAVCTLGNVILPSFVKYKGDIPYFDYEDLNAVVQRLCLGLNSVINGQVLPTEKATNSSKNLAAIGIGTQGLANAILAHNAPYASSRGRKLNREIAENVYYAALTASCELAEDTKPYTHYLTNGGSYLSKSLFHWEVDEPYKHDLTCDWETLRVRIRLYGVANSLVTAYAPTSTTSIIEGNQESIQPITSNIVSRSTLSGDYIVVEPRLCAVLEKLGMWNEHTKNEIIRNRGSISTLNVSAELKELYATAYEISTKSQIEMNRDRDYFIDQGQSFNMFIPHNKDFSSFFDSAIMYAWKIGCKNLLYYARQQLSFEALLVNTSVELSCNKKVDEEVKSPEICRRQPNCLICE